eukprot:scaffold19706_cov29-Tisochrysis_lutea.AAC.4
MIECDQSGGSEAYFSLITWPWSSYGIWSSCCTRASSTYSLASARSIARAAICWRRTNRGFSESMILFRRTAAASIAAACAGSSSACGLSPPNTAHLSRKRRSRYACNQARHASASESRLSRGVTLAIASRRAARVLSRSTTDASSPNLASFSGCARSISINLANAFGWNSGFARLSIASHEAH